MESLLKKSAIALAILASTSIINLSYAENEAATAQKTVKLDCFLTDQMSQDKKPGESKDTFITTTPIIYAICTSSDLNKGQSLTAEWIAADTHKVAPDNYKILSKKVDVPEGTKAGEKLTFDFLITKPNKDWPTGTYHVDFYVDDQKSKTESVNFTISANKTTE